MIELGGSFPEVYVLPFNVTLKQCGMLEVRDTASGGHIIVWNGMNLLDLIEEKNQIMKRCDDGLEKL